MGNYLLVASVKINCSSITLKCFVFNPLLFNKLENSVHITENGCHVYGTKTVLHNVFCLTFMGLCKKTMYSTMSMTCLQLQYVMNRTFPVIDH